MTEIADQGLLTKGLDRVLPPGWRWLRLLFSAIGLVYLALTLLSGTFGSDAEAALACIQKTCIQKTGARNRTEALRVAEERGWL